MNSNSSMTPEVHQQLNVVEALGRTLLMIMVVQLLGYVVKRMRLAPAGFEGGVGFYVGMIALPALLFRSVATLDLSTIEPVLVGSVLLAKMVVVAVAVGIGRLYTKASEPPGSAIALCGLMALATTSSDDIGLGLPVMQALSPAGSPGARLVPLLFVLSALQSLIISPLCYLMLGVGSARVEASEAAANSSNEGADGTPSPPPSTSAVLFGVLRRLRKNPLVLSVLLGLAYNLAAAAANGGFGAVELPWYLDQPLRLLGRAFTPLVLFLAGSASVGSFTQLASLRAAALPALWVGLQSFLLPFLARVLVQSFGGDSDEVRFAFVYGLLPCANSVLVIARGYKLRPELLGSVAAYLALGKVLTFPLLFLAALISSIADEVNALIRLRVSASTMALGFSSLGLGFIVLSALGIDAWRRCPLRRTLLYVVLQLLFSALHLCEPLVSGASSGRTAKLSLYVCTSCARWATSGLAAVLAVEDARKALGRARVREQAIRGKLGGGDGGGPVHMPSEVETDMQHAIRHLRFHVCVPLASAAVFTLPWALACEMPEAPCLLLWVPYEGGCGTSQRVVYLVAYVVTGLVVLSSLVVTLASARTSDGANETATTSSSSSESLPSTGGGGNGAHHHPSRAVARDGGSALGERRQTSGLSSGLSEADVSEHGTSFAVYKRTGTKLRLRILLVVVSSSCVFHAILLASILDASSQVSSATACAITPSFALGLIILVLLFEGQGIYIFASFGLQPEILHAVRRWPQKISDVVADSACLRRACCLPASGGGSLEEEEGLHEPLALMEPHGSMHTDTELAVRMSLAAEPRL